MRLRLVLEYDGTEFAGFQLQGQGERTVQGVLETALGRLAHAEVRVHAAGRTDAGVHATGQVAHADVAWNIPERAIAAALNAALPADLVVKAAAYADPGFHARFDATRRVYRYAILNRRAPSALLARFVWQIREPLDVEAMRVAAAVLTGTHDFAAFGKPEAPGKSTIRRMDRIVIRSWRDCLLVTVCGNAFLRQMVRAMVGTLQQVGSGKWGAADVWRLLESGDRRLCPPIAPARGLCLARVEYTGTRRI